MPVNPAVKPEMLNNPTQRANSLNDPQFSEQQGYFPYDLSHGEYITPRFAEGTPTMHLDTVPADRFAVHDNTKLVLNRIQGNLLSTLNQYVDSFYVPLRSCFPNNYEKLIPNPTKGSDLPNTALPQIPFCYWINQLLRCNVPITVNGHSENHRAMLSQAVIRYLNADNEDNDSSFANYGISWMLLISSMLSRGQLLDYLGVQFDNFDYAISTDDYRSSQLQQRIDDFWQALYAYSEAVGVEYVGSYELNLTSNSVDFSGLAKYSAKVDTISRWRSAISDIFERGEFPRLNLSPLPESNEKYIRLRDTYNSLYQTIQIIFVAYDYETLSMTAIDESPTPWENGGFLNITKPLAYQQIFAHYYSNDSIDNIFTSELFMQNLRAVMYPTDTRFTSEPVFEYNGVQTEYDYMSCAGWYYSLMFPNGDDEPVRNGFLARSWVVGTLLFHMRRTLRYGDYFSTARPRMLAVSGQLNVAIGYDEEGNATGVSPIDITKNLLMQRYLNAANYVGSRFLNYYASMYGVTPSDTGTFPRFLAHRKIELQNQITNNTAGNQGEQTTNLVGYSDNNAFDVFIDDFGVILSITSFDVLPVYTSGIDSSYHFSDRFDYFNPMLQNVGDQPILFSELVGSPEFNQTIFGWTMRNAELKFKISRAHGALVNDLPGFLIKYPFSSFGSRDASGSSNFIISPEFIRDKPRYLDPYIPAITGASPAAYYHFVCACLNQVHCARKVQAQPPVLF